jgi:NAD(P)-dependent dehydrogenase (short-subunit alcohol dehydrogenase family)
MSFALQLKSRRALVTGGGRGDGKAVVETLRGAGAQLVAMARSLQVQPADAVHYVAADLSTEDGCAVVAQSAMETEAAVAFAKRIAAQVGTDYECGKQIIMKGLGGIPLGRPPRPGEVVDLIAFFVSPRGAAIAGTEYVIEGGTIPTV